MSTTNLIFGSADSNIFEHRKLESDVAQNAIMTFRLHALVSMVIGTTVVIPEGWGLDSFCFHQVVAEFYEAYRKWLKADSPLYAYAFAPFKMEREDPGHSYLHVFEKFLAKGDVHWSGMPSFREQRNTQSDLLKVIRENGIENGRRTIDAVAHHMSELLDDPKAAMLWRGTAHYFAHHRARAVVVANREFVLHDTIRLAHQKLLADPRMLLVPEGRLINDYVTNLERYNINDTEGSDSLSFLKQNYDFNERSALEYFLHFMYIVNSGLRLSSNIGIGRTHFEYPKFIDDLQIVMQRMGVFRARDKRTDTIIVEQVAASSALRDWSLSVDWSQVWTQVLDVIMSKEWDIRKKELIKRMLVATDVRQVFDSIEWERFCALFNSESSVFSIRKTALQRIGFEVVQKRLTNDAQDTLMIVASATAVLCAIAVYISTQSELLGVLPIGAAGALRAMQVLRSKHLTLPIMGGQRTTIFYNAGRD